MTDHPPLRSRDVRPLVPFVTPKVTTLSNGMSYPEFADQLMRSMADALGVPHHLLESKPLRPSLTDNTGDPQFPDMMKRRLMTRFRK